MADKATATPRIGRAIDPDWSQRKASAAALVKFAESFTKEMGAKYERNAKTTYQVIPTGSLELDVAIGIGGWPRGRISEVWGPEHAGKTTLAMMGVASAQKTFPDQVAAWVDMEQTFDSDWAIQNGVDMSRLMLFTPEAAEDTADAVKRFVGSGLCSLVVLDSVGGMISRAEIDKEADEATIAKVAGIVTRMVKASAPMARKNDTAVLVANQVRARIAKFGADTHTSGGWALKHVTSVKVKVSQGPESPKVVTVRGDSVQVGRQIACRVEKNKIRPMGAVARFWLYNQDTKKYGPMGVDWATEVITTAKAWGVLPPGAWIPMPDGERLQGVTKAAEYLKSHPDQSSLLRERVLEKVKGVIEEETGLEPSNELADYIDGHDDETEGGQS